MLSSVDKENSGNHTVISESNTRLLMNKVSTAIRSHVSKYYQVRSLPLATRQPSRSALKVSTAVWPCEPIYYIKDAIKYHYSICAYAKITHGISIHLTLFHILRIAIDVKLYFNAIYLFYFIICAQFLKYYVNNIFADLPFNSSKLLFSAPKFKPSLDKAANTALHHVIIIVLLFTREIKWRVLKCPLLNMLGSIRLIE